jgi:hypothetical protein
VASTPPDPAAPGPAFGPCDARLRTFVTKLSVIRLGRLKLFRNHGSKHNFTQNIFEPKHFECAPIGPVVESMMTNFRTEAMCPLTRADCGCDMMLEGGNYCEHTCSFSVVYVLVAFALGISSHKMYVLLGGQLILAMHRPQELSGVEKSKFRDYRDRENTVEMAEDAETDTDSEATSDADSRRRKSKLGQNSGQFSESQLSRRGLSFASSMRKISTLSGLQHGLVEARGRNLQIFTVDQSARRMLGWPMDPSDCEVPLPSTVHDLLPAEIRAGHRRFFEKATEEGVLPSSLMHPVRNAPMLRLDGTVIRVDLCIGVITKVHSLNRFAICHLSDRPRADKRLVIN